DAEIVNNAVDAANALQPLERCSDARLLRAMLPPPENARARAAVEAVRRQIAEAKALHDAGKGKTAAEKARAALAEARRVDDGPALAEALALVGYIASDAGDNDAAQAALKEAVWQAEAARHDEAKAEAAVLLVMTAARHNRYDEAGDWGRQADA